MQRWTLLAALSALAGTIVMVVMAVLGTPAGEEDALARWAQQIGPWFEPIAIVVRGLTHTVPVLGIGALLAVGLVLNDERRRALVFGVLILVMALLQTGIKEVLDRERRSPAYVEVRDTWTSPSYPAGHLMSGTFLWGYLVVSVVPRRVGRGTWAGIRAFSAAVVLLNVPANVYMGVHWPTDVLGGLFLGAALAAAVKALEMQQRRGG